MTQEHKIVRVNPGSSWASIQRPSKMQNHNTLACELLQGLVHLAILSCLWERNAVISIYGSFGILIAK